MSEPTAAIVKLEKQLRVLKKKLERSEWHRVDLENQHDRDQHLYRRLQSDLETAHREAQVEAALERVRARTMAMRASDELREVVTTVYEELHRLGVDAPVCMLATRDDGRDGYTIWISNLLQAHAPESYHVPPLEHPVYERIVDAWDAGVPYLVTEVDGADKQSFGRVLFEETEMGRLAEPVKRAMLSLDRVVLSTAFTPHGFLEASGPRALSDEDAEVLQRVARVFDQAYTRLLDLQKAEAQARESQIEAALERIRSRTMGMRSSDELSDVIGRMFSELTHLDFDLTRCVIWVIDPETRSARLWMANAERPNEPDSYHIPYHDHPSYHAFLDAWDRQEALWTYDLHGELKTTWDAVLFSETELRRLPDEVKAGMAGSDRVLLTASFTPFGALHVASLESLADESAAILRRVATVFDQAYTRYLDLEQAEARAREAQIEVALERVRSRALAMTTSEELLDVIQKIHHEYVGLGLPGEVFWQTRYTPESYHKAVTSVGGEKVSAIMELPRDFSMVPELAAWERGEEKIGVFHFDAEAAASYVHHMNTKGHFLRVDPDGITPEIARELGGLTFVQARTSHGEIGFALWGVAHPSQEAQDVLVRFATTFDLAYRRFLDLRGAEAKSRELQIEVALERVRSRALEMTTSDELLDVVFKIHEEYSGLGLECGAFWHTRYTPEVYQKALTSIDGKKLAAIMELPRDFASNPALAAWEHGGEEIGVFPFDAEAGAQYMRHMAEKGQFSEIDPEAITVEMVREHGGITFVQARTSHGEIGYSLWGEAEPTEEAKSVLTRFATTFDLAYRRFLDLQRAEADHQALVAEKAATDRALVELRATQARLVQKEKMASLGQLTAGIAHEIKNPLNFVNNFAQLSKELVDELAEVDSEAERDEILGDLRQNAAKIEEHGRRADAIVRSMMEHARSGSGPHRPVALNALVEEHAGHALHAVRVRHPHFDPALEVRLGESVGEVVIEPQEIGRVLVNLVDNALDAVRQRAASGANGYVPSVTVSTAQVEGQVVVRVADNGPGIPEAVRAKIFEPFFTTKPTGEGTGLGLSLSHDIVAQGHGGSLAVESAEGEGATFVLSLPAAP